MPLTRLLSLLACGSDPESFRPHPVVTEVTWIQDGVETPLDDGEFWLDAVTAADGSCAPSTRIVLMSRATSYQVFLDLSAYRSGAEVLTPSAWPYPLRFPTLLRFTPAEDRRSANTTSSTGGGTAFVATSWSGGPATFTVGGDFVHTLSLEAPTRCAVSYVQDCGPSTPVTFRFTGDLTEVSCTLEAIGGDGESPSGLPYCVAGEDGACPPLE